MTKGQVDMAKLKHQSNHTDFNIHTCILIFLKVIHTRVQRSLRT